MRKGRNLLRKKEGKLSQLEASLRDEVQPCGHMASGGHSFLFCAQDTVGFFGPLSRALGLWGPGLALGLGLWACVNGSGLRLEVGYLC